MSGAGGADSSSSGGESGLAGSAAVGAAGTGTEPSSGGAPMEAVGGAGTDEGTDEGAAGAPAEDGGECMVGTTSGNEVVIIGESFIAASSIGQDLAEIAIEHGSLQPGESYINNSVSGTRLGDGAIPGQYARAAQSNPIRFVLMDGGGNDCLQANDSNSPISAAEELFAQMAEDGVEKIVYFFYPDPAGMFGGAGSSLKSCLDVLRPKMKAVCDELTSPKCYWLDLRETSWTGNESAYTSDGIHPNAQGSQVTAEAIWEVMEANCVAQ